MAYVVLDPQQQQQKKYIKIKNNAKYVKTPTVVSNNGSPAA